MGKERECVCDASNRGLGDVGNASRQRDISNLWHICISVLGSVQLIKFDDFGVISEE